MSSIISSPSSCTTTNCGRLVSSLLCDVYDCELIADSRAPVPRERGATSEDTLVVDVGKIAKEYVDATGAVLLCDLSVYSLLCRWLD